MRAIIDHVSSIANLVSRHYLESALASGRASPAMLRGEGEYLERGRDLVSEAVKLAREGGLDARGAERLLAEGDGRLSRGENGLAFVSYSLAFRSVLKLWRPFEAVPPAGGSDATLAADGPRAAPYDVD
jgi:hypothetical protein